MSDTIQTIQYVQTQTKITHNTSLSCQARITYQVLMSYCHNNKITCFPNLKSIAEKVGKSTRSVIRYINELIGAGLVKRQNRGHHSNLYTLKGLIAYDDTFSTMIELNETNCTKQDEEYSYAQKAMARVKKIIKNNTSDGNKRPYKKSYNKKDTAGERKDEYAPNMDKILNQMRNNAREAFKDIKDKLGNKKGEDFLFIDESDLPF